jgi:hypothetical protein
MADAPPAAAVVPPALAMSSPEAVGFLAMLAERQTALEARVAELSASVTSLTAYTAVMPAPKAFYIVLEQPEGVQLVDVRRSVLAAIAMDRRRPELVSVRCFLSTSGPWDLQSSATAALVYVTFLATGTTDRGRTVETDPAAAAAEFAAMHVNLARCGTRVLQTHTVMSPLEDKLFQVNLQENEVFVPIRASEAPLLRVPGSPREEWMTADVALGWCKRDYVDNLINDLQLILNWQEANAFNVYAPANV